MNTLKIVFLMTLMTVLLVGVGQLVGGSQGAVLALVLAGGMNLLAAVLDPSAHGGACRPQRSAG